MEAVIVNTDAALEAVNPSRSQRIKASTAADDIEQLQVGSGAATRDDNRIG
jgi:hypothetical protein